jgi:hypothetical protein
MLDVPLASPPLGATFPRHVLGERQEVGSPALLVIQRRFLGLGPNRAELT